jgi:serine/threonine protein phosphatase PrpC
MTSTSNAVRATSRAEPATPVSRVDLGYQTVVVSGLTGSARAATPPQIVAHELLKGGLAARAVTYRGTLHALGNVPRQDAFALSTNEDWLFAVVSDGVGSCEYSQHGSTAAVNAVATALALDLADPHDGRSLMELASAACFELAGQLDVDPDSMSATLTIAAIAAAAQPDGSRHVLLHAVGDSPVLLLRPAEADWTYVTAVADGPSNIIREWIPGRHNSSYHAGCLLPESAVLILCSDGFSVPLGDGSGLLGIDLARRWAAGPRELLPFLTDLSFDAYHDDKTVVAVWNTAKAETTQPGNLSEQEHPDG